MNTTKEPLSCSEFLACFFMPFLVWVAWREILAFLAIIAIIAIPFLITAYFSASNGIPRTYHSAPEGSYQWYVNRFFSTLKGSQSGQEAYFGTLSIDELDKMHSAVNQWKNQGGKFNKRESEVFDWMTDIINK